MNNNRSKAVRFLRDNAVYLVLALCIIAIGLSITFMIIKKSKEASVSGGDTAVIDPINEDPVDPTGGEITEPTEPVVNVIEFGLPVKNATEVCEYSETMVFNSTLGRFSTHKAIDYFAQEGSDVYAVYGGTVESVDNTLLTGVTVTVDHGNGLKSVYNSLADVDFIRVGAKVNKGDIIGQVSVSNRQEANEGAHLHFYVTENGQVIDPNKYFIEDLK